ncbi:hypothetical protein AMTR_s00038p00131700 [Amborella trichopoda]|uniref:Translation elongation factor EF1B beta/delta subunit guanine nucleotide exchange domain-containing protein n=1 Tax=Amborella trichopoda TaxID=13333 RepID=U5CXB9_AMBTC|nr:hypothetical protein AMTR_s00038p00131700 [Amborella trichopoda]
MIWISLEMKPRKTGRLKKSGQLQILLPRRKRVGKSSILLDVKPWDDETDMKKLEEAVRSIEMPDLFWGSMYGFFTPLCSCCLIMDSMFMFQLTTKDGYACQDTTIRHFWSGLFLDHHSSLLWMVKTLMHYGFPKSIANH